jgi:hypothetical protein
VLIEADAHTRAAAIPTASRTAAAAKMLLTILMGKFYCKMSEPPTSCTLKNKRRAVGSSPAFGNKRWEIRKRKPVIVENIPVLQNTEVSLDPDKDNYLCLYYQYYHNYSGSQ